MDPITHRERTRSTRDSVEASLNRLHVFFEDLMPDFPNRAVILWHARVAQRRMRVAPTSCSRSRSLATIANSSTRSRRKTHFVPWTKADATSRI